MNNEFNQLKKHEATRKRGFEDYDAFGGTIGAGPAA